MTCHDELDWRLPSADPALEAGEVHVWRAVTPASDDSRLAAWRGALDSTERRREQKLRDDSARRDFVTARGLLRRRLAAALGGSVEALRLEAGPHGRPRLAGDVARTDRGTRLDFNVSHSGGFVLVAISDGARVGVDVERPRDIDTLAIARRYFAPAEIRALEALEGDARSRAFYRMWVCKEAYAKAVGRGLQISLASFEVTAPEDGPASLVRAHQGETEPWRLLELDVGSPMHAAIVVSTRSTRVLCFEATRR